ncbi:ROK family protein [Palleronia rufa]|uniref:ROK family protein n=1 Tax=Palleronia rufa TaxID=1530186 RepID=UPI00055D1E44|nr:ROK family protein [Palleronia rufa]
MIGGIDLGGTKIESRLFDRGGAPRGEALRLPTPRDYPSLLDALAGQVRALDDRAGMRVPVGLAAPGVVAPGTGRLFAANLAATDRPLGADLAARAGRPVPVVNDGMAFALSEARGGAAADARVALGLVIGTGLGGGVTVDGRLPPRHAGYGVEIGHAGLPGRALLRHSLDLRPCGCGRLGCAEAYLSGPGLAALAGGGLPPGAAVPDAALDIWADLAAETLQAPVLVLDPAVIVLGGGVSLIPGLIDRLGAALDRHRLGGAPAPALAPARFGATSGARGAALLAGDASC